MCLSPDANIIEMCYVYVIQIHINNMETRRSELPANAAVWQNPWKMVGERSQTQRQVWYGSLVNCLEKAES